MQPTMHAKSSRVGDAKATWIALHHFDYIRYRANRLWVHNKERASIE